MKNFTKLLMLITLWVLAHQASHAQCPLSGTVYGTAAAPTTCVPAYASPTCHYTSSSGGDYASFTALVAGSTYKIVTSSTAGSQVPNTDELTIYLSTNTTTGSHVAYGTGGTVTFTPAVSGTYFVVINKSGSACGTAESVCRYPSIQCTTCSPGPLNCTTNTAPANAATGVSLTPVLSWAAATNAASYEVFIGTSVAGATSLGTTPSTSVTLTPVANLQPNTTYFWYIVPIGCDNIGASGCSANATSFTTQAPPPANNECSGAVTVTPQPFQISGCPSSVSGTTVNATLSTSPTTTFWGTSNDDDVWYSFTTGASITSQVVRFCNVTFPVGTATNMGLELYSSCTGTGIVGPTVTITSGAGETTIGSLTANTTYYLRVFTSGTTARANFDISVLNPPPPPANDLICGAISLSVSANLTCTTLLTGQTTQYSTAGATACAGTADDDVWYSFVATSSSHIITLTNSGSGLADRVHQVYSSSDNTCTGTLTSISCSDPESSTLTGLTAGNTYFIRVHSFATSGFSTFDICVTSVVPPACTNNTVPSNGATGVALLPVLTWASAVGATSYDIYFVGTLPTAWTNPVNSTSTSYTITATNTLVANTTYTWYVVPRNATGAAVGCSSNTTTFTTVAAATTFSGSGLWSDATKWSAGLPSCQSPVTIASGANCVVDVAAVSGSITVSGILGISSNSLTVGCTSGGGNRTFNIAASGRLDMSGGTLTVNGNFALTSGGKFNQSGGNIYIDGNAGGVIANSVASGTNIVTLNVAAATDVTLTGGNFYVVDPHAASSGAAFLASITPQVGITATVGHTLFFGDGVSTDPGGTQGAQFYSWQGTGILRPGNVTIMGPGGTNRFVSLTSSFYNMVIQGTLTVNSGGELRQLHSSNTTGSIVAAGNIVNDGIITALGGIHLANANATTSTTLTYSGTTNAQTISGSGVWRNLTSSPTANMTSFTVNNTSGTPISLPANMISGVGTGSVSGTLTLTSGKLDVGTTPFTLGTTAASNGTLSPSIPASASYIIGEFRRWITNSTGNRYFPVGTLNNTRFAQINFTTSQATGGLISAVFNNIVPDANGLPYTEGGINIQNVSPSGSWTINRLSGSGGVYTIIVDAIGFTQVNGSSITDLANVRLIKRSNGGNWGVGNDGTSASPLVLATATRTGCTAFSEFAIGGTFAALPIELKSFTGKTLKSTNMLEWVTSTEQNVREHVIERSLDGFSNWTLVGKTPSKGDSRQEQFYSLEDKAPLAKAFYRLRSVDYDGKEQLSGIISLTRLDNSFGVVSAYPNPATESINIDFNSLEEGMVMANITDMTGRLIQQQQMSVEKGVNTMTLTLLNLGAGTYYISLQNGNQVTMPVRFIKQ